MHRNVLAAWLAGIFARVGIARAEQHVTSATSSDGVA